MSVKATTEDGIGRLTLSHPPLNILTRDVMAAMRAELERFASDPSLRVLVLAAEGKHFSAGADVGEHLPPQYRELIPEFLETIRAVDTFPQPTVAAVRGRCLGGGFELVQAVDLIVAGEGSRFGQPEILLGVLPPAACVILPRRAAWDVAAEVVFTGDPIDAAQAQRAGLVRRVVPDDRVDAEALALAQAMARHSAAALRITKRALRAGIDASRSAAFVDVGRLYIDELMETEDAVEGLRAFLDKRQPTWAHR